VQRTLRTISLLSLLAAGCATTRGDRPAPRTLADYRIEREDVLEVVVWREPELTRVLPVRPDGKIAFPLAGELEAAGKTPADLRQELTQALAPFVRDVSVAVLVKEINGSKFYVLGEVHRPGAFPLRGSTSVLQALALAGGTDEFAGNEVVWLRQRPDGGEERVSLSYREMVKGAAEGALWLAAGDVVYVP
jgi:polysaccharide export outer membrane protein